MGSVRLARTSHRWKHPFQSPAHAIYRPQGEMLGYTKLLKGLVGSFRFHSIRLAEWMSDVLCRVSMLGKGEEGGDGGVGWGGLLGPQITHRSSTPENVGSSRNTWYRVLGRV